MTTEEKAKELVEKFYNQLMTATPNLNRPKYQAKQCALVAVEEIVKLCKILDYYETSLVLEDTKDWKCFYEKVKEEINKL